MASSLGKRKSPDPDAFDHDEPQTPLESPPRKKLKITQQQKQALIENLRLEITERARTLRAHYALQAQDLRARIERRINRIPMALRKKTMGELLAKHQEEIAGKKSPSKTNASPSVFKKSGMLSKTTGSPRSAGKGTSGKRPATKVARVPRRRTDDLHSSDKENAPCHDSMSMPLANPKKRGKAAAPGGKARVISQHAQGSVLSPKSSNSRTYPQSPLKQSPQKPQLYKSHPTSPLKPSIGNMDENNKGRISRSTGRKILSPQSTPASQNRPSSAASFTMKKSIGPKSTNVGRKTISRPATRQQHTRAASTSTVASNASVGTTIVKNTRSGTTATKKAATGTSITKKAPASRGQTGTAASNARRTATAAGVKKAAATEAPSTGRRVLRNRI